MELINSEELIEGMVIAKPILNEHGIEILKEGVKLKDNIIEAIKRRGIKEVYVRDLFTMDFNPVDSVVRDMKKRYLTEIIKLAPDMKSAGASDEIVIASQKAVEIIPKIYENEKIAKICFEMKIISEVYYQHAVTTSALSLIVALLKGLNQAEAYTTAVAGLFHDIGLLEMSAIVNHKRKTEQEEALWKESPTYSYYLLKENGFPERIANIVKNCRETWIGDGYPAGVAGELIPLESRIVFLSQMYDELLRYDGLMPYEALEYIFAGSGYYFDPELVTIFTDNISVYPLKSMVRLTNGEVGVVVNVRKNRGPRPIVKVYYDSFNKPIKTPKELDLGIEKTVFIKEILSL